MADSMVQDSPARAVLVTLLVALVCAFFVSITAVTLRPNYTANLEAERLKRLGSIVLALQEVSGPVSQESIQARVVNLESGSYVDSIDPASFDARRAARNPAQSSAIPPDLDLAGIKRREDHAVVYLVGGDDEDVDVVILPVWGVGYQSALHGFLALDGSASRVVAFRIYEHGETPGLGSRVQDPEWEESWSGKRAFDDNGTVLIRVAGPGGADRSSRVDAISGATRTSLGVSTMVRFWLGEFGFGPYLARLRQGRG